MSSRARWMGLMALAVAAATQAGTHAKLLPVHFKEVKIQDEFWSKRLEVNHDKTVPHNLKMCEDTGRIDNFAHAAGLAKGRFRGHIFHDSDVYKFLEGLIYALILRRDPALEERLERIVDLIRKSQQPDGYLNTFFTVKAPQQRWTNLRSAHELYCAGHMFEAAVAHFELTGKKTFLDVASRFADHIDGVFGPGKRHAVPGHEEIELALVKLWRATGQERYLRLAQFFVDEHGQAKTHQLFGRYCQDHMPIREQGEPVGHCVRAMYLYSAVADLAAITGDHGYRDAMERLWRHVVSKRMYVTGGIGVQRHGEGFASDYLLPNYDAYCETCAAIGMAFWNHRLALLFGEGRFADIVELELYNGALAGVSLDGERFFYVNPLASRGGHHRRGWYGCACCPTNIVRFIPAVGGYAYAAAADGSGAYVLQYLASTATVPLRNGRVSLVQKTGYPWDGAVQVIVEPEGAGEFGLSLRIPGWCGGASVRVNGKLVESPQLESGFATIRRAWSSGDIIGLDLPMPVRRVASHPKVKNNAGRLALLRGPIVYCLEDVDHDCPVDQVAVPAEAKLEAKFEPKLLGGVVVLRGKGMSAGWPETLEDLKKPWPADVTAVPYYAWDNRAPGRMVVWIPKTPPVVALYRNVTVAVLGSPTASHCHSSDAVAALNDCILPRKSIDHSIPRFTWWDHLGTKEWVAYEFKRPQVLSKAEVYWFDDTGRGRCRVPKSWRLLWRDGDTWRPVEATSPYGVERDRLNAVTFQAVTTRAIRLEVQLQPNVSGGILEWRLPK